MKRIIRLFIICLAFTIWQNSPVYAIKGTGGIRRPTEGVTYNAAGEIVENDVPAKSDTDSVSSEMIKEVQEKLNELGYNCGTADGIAGMKTSEAIAKFQTDYGYDVDGEVQAALITNLEMAIEQKEVQEQKSNLSDESKISELVQIIGANYDDCFGQISVTSLYGHNGKIAVSKDGIGNVELVSFTFKEMDTSTFQDIFEGLSKDFTSPDLEGDVKGDHVVAWYEEEHSGCIMLSFAENKKCVLNVFHEEDAGYSEMKKIQAVSECIGTIVDASRTVEVSSSGANIKDLYGYLCSVALNADKDDTVYSVRFIFDSYDKVSYEGIKSGLKDDYGEATLDGDTDNGALVTWDNALNGKRIALQLINNESIILYIYESKDKNEGAKTDNSISSRPTLTPKPTSTPKPVNPSTSHVCIECGKRASHSIEGFSGEPEWYCDEHWNEMMDALGTMEQDVGNGSYSTHLCQAPGCTREGTYQIIGFSGSDEYYCTEHYQEMLDILNMMYDDVG